MRTTKANLEAILGEFDIIERYVDAESTVDAHLKQIRRNARLGVTLEEWASQLTSSEATRGPAPRVKTR